jgi:putative membrane protein
MIVNPSASHLRLLFTLRGSILLEVVPQIAVIVAWAVLVVALHQSAPDWCPSFNGAALSLIGIALSVFMGFRNSICYERWWKGDVSSVHCSGTRASSPASPASSTTPMARRARGWSI